MARSTLLALLIAVNLFQGVLIWRLAGGGPGGGALAPPTVVVVWGAQAGGPAALQAAARRVDLATDAEWHNAARLLCGLLERYGAIAGSASADEIASRLAARDGPGAEARALRADLLREARAGRDRIRGSQAEAAALEAELSRLAELLARRCPEEAEGPGEGDPWERLRDRLEAGP